MWSFAFIFQSPSESCYPLSGRSWWGDFAFHVRVSVSAPSLHRPAIYTVMISTWRHCDSKDHPRPHIDAMVSFHTGLTSAIAVLSVLGSTLAVPLTDKLKLLSPAARDVLKRSTPAAPRFVVYNDMWLNPFPSASQLQVRNIPMVPSF